MKILRFFSAIIILTMLMIACRKDVGLLPIPDNIIQTSQSSDSVDFGCVIFPQWFHAPPDSVTYPEQQAMYWEYVPHSKSKVVYTVNNYVWTYDFKTHQRVFITDKMQHLPDCNREGWILFSDYRNQGIFKIKINGDSLTRLTYEGLGGARWDYTGTAIYYFSELRNMLYKIDVIGNKLDSAYNVPVGFTAFSKISDKLYYGKTLNGAYALVCLDMSTKQEKIISTDVIGDLVIDNKDENIYARTFDALIKFNITSKKIDTLLKDCDSHLISWPNISANSDNVMTIGCAFTKFLDPKVDSSIKKPRLLRWTKTFEIDVDDPKQQFKEINLFP